MKFKQRPEDFSVTESWRFDEDPSGDWYVYLMDKQKVSTFEAIDRIAAKAHLAKSAVSAAGLKDKQGRTTQLIAVRGQVELQDPDLRLKLLGRTAGPLTAANTTSNRFAVTVRDLTEDDVSRIPAAVAEVQRLGVINYFDSQRFGSLKHGQGFIIKDLMRGDAEIGLRNTLARPSDLDQTSDAKVKQFWKEHWGEWQLKNPYVGAERYAPVIRWLRLHPKDHLGAFLRTEPRWRALQVFAYQSWLWNEGVKQYLRDTVGITHLLAIQYQAGALLFPRTLNGEMSRRLENATFPLLAPSSSIPDPAIRKAALSVLEREDMTLQSLQVPGAPQIHFDHEERRLLVHPGKLVVGEPRPDELNRDRLRVNVAFTLPPGAYASLMIKRLFAWTLEPRRENRPEPKKKPTAAEIHEQRKQSGFLAQQRAKKAAKKAQSAQKTAAPATSKTKAKAKPQQSPRSKRSKPRGAHSK